MDGNISFGQYDVIERLRVGGSTETVRARDNRTDRLVALTRLLPETAADPQRRDALAEEARVAGALDHPHIARLLDAGEIEGCWFVAYEHVEGRDLRRIIEHAASQLEPLPLPFLVHVARRVADAIAHAHEAAPPLLHGCLTPQNITVSFAGDVKVIGFGAGKASRGYRSPEQLRGEPLDPRTDLFSLGICLWEALTARRLFPEGDEALAVDALDRWSPEAPSRRRADVPLELDRIVMKLLAKDATERYGSARRFSRDLSNFVAQSGAAASRDDVARWMRETFDDEATRSTGRTMELQETRRMSDDKNGGGSDLDIFEGLGKKSSATQAAVPPPPPGSSGAAHLAGALAPKPTELKKTLLGIAQPAQPPSAQNLPAVQPSSQSNMPAIRPSAPPASGSMRAVQPVSQPPVPGPPAASKPPPPPPGRGSLPNLAAQPTSQPPMAAAAPSATQKSAPPPVPAPVSTRPTAVAAAQDARNPAASSQPNGKQLDMDWDDDDEATHVFDKESKDNQKAAAPLGEPDRADMDAILSSPPRTSSVPMPAAGTPPPPPPATLSGAFASLGQANGSQPPSAAFKSGPPASQSIRSAPPPPPVSQRSPSQSPISAVPPPPPPGSPTTQPMHMPPRPPSAPPPSGAHPAHAQQMPAGGGMHQPMSNFPSAPPVSHQPPVSAVAQVGLPPVSRMMEPTAIVPRPQPSRAGLWVGLLVAVMAIVGIAVFLLMPRTGTLVVNVADTKGASVPNLQVLVDGTKKCDSAPCILKDVPAGVHEVKVVAPGFDALAPRAVTIEARRDATTDFTLGGGKSVGGTGFKVAGSQPGVKVTVDGKDLGTLPAEAHDLEPGEHKLHFAGSDRYAPLDKTISIGKDEIVDVGNIQLKVLKGKAMITLGTPGARVFLVSGATRKEVPQFPIAIDFDPNEHWQLEAKKDGFDDFVKPISFEDGIAEKTIDVTLSPKGSHAPQPQAQLAAPPQPVAQAPVQARPQPVAKAEPPAQKDTSTDTPPAKKDPPAAAAGGEAFLNINSLPASTVVLDGKPLGPTPRVHVQVSPGSHTVLFVNAEQSLKKSISVTVGAGETKAAFAKLRE